jgi:transposase
MITLSHDELDRLSVVRAVVEKRLKQRPAAERLRLSTRQLKRLVGRYRREGPAGLASRHRGRPSNHRIAEAVRSEAMSLIQERYQDFGPTLACEKLAQRHEVHVSVETVRQWMIAAELWRAKPRYEGRVFARRERRACVGELVQIDGSNHEWFEARSERCTLIVFIDDASGRLQYLRFVPAESTWAYLEGLRQYLSVYGRPMSLYSDRHSVFRINDLQAVARGEVLTQFGRVLQALQIESIHAHTPQAKGRVERANATLQDRLVKELRLAGINDMDAGNAFLEQYRAQFNERFAVQPRSIEDAHRPVLHEDAQLELMFTLQFERTVSKNLEIHYDKRIYQIQAGGRARRLRHSKVIVCEHQDGSLLFVHCGRALETLLLPPLAMPMAKKSSPDRRTLKPRPTINPAPNHPWRRAAVQPHHSPHPKGTSLLGTKGDTSTLR